MEFKRERELQRLISKKNNHMIKVVTGIRRCGKSYLLDTIFKNHLISEGVKESHIIRFAFDFGEDIDKLDEYFENEPTRIRLGRKNDYVINAKKFRAFIKDKTTEAGQYFILLDEVQRLEDFAETINGFLRHDNYDVYVTGSNSKFLSSEIATEFRGRGDVISLQPLTFKEIYDAIGGEKNELLDEYLRHGGLPLCVLAKGDENKEQYLASTYDTTYVRDFLDRGIIKNEVQFKEITQVLASSVGSMVNPLKIENTFRSRENAVVTDDTIQTYISHMVDAFIVKGANRFDVKGRKYIGSTCKYYFTDLGIRNAVLGFRQNERTHLMENIIFNELVYRGYQVDVGSVEKSEKNASGSYIRKSMEVDFVATKGSMKIYIQSAFSIDEIEKKTQEERPLKEIKDSFKKIIITYGSCKPYYTEDGLMIIGLLDFLLGEI